MFVKYSGSIHVLCMSLGWVGLDFRGLLPPLFEETVLNLFSNMTTAVEIFSLAEECPDDVTPPNLMEHPPLAVFINGVSTAMNELRPIKFENCAGVGSRAALISEAKNSFDRIGRLLASSKSQEPPKPLDNADEHSISENGHLPKVEKGVLHSTEQTPSAGVERKEQHNNSPQKEKQAINENVRGSPVIMNWS
ncbi:Conserved oligomeric Golgi complex subunit [Sesamum alatum]|uniref:Conserved oligomeric Golgi complex subunit 8 n=1 Tax=Sesamum alatum TaxID=300844 RepID=A0AAE2CHH3_9LAMI|nr:Conserved oligomeric Golgi complex subunit [Sesamum alatum]